MHFYYQSTLLEILIELGVSESQLLAKAVSRSRPLSKAASVTTADLAAQMDSMCSAALELTHDRQLGLKLGSRIDIASQGIFGYALLSSSTIGDALKLLVRYNRAILPSIRIELIPNAGSFEISVRAPQLPYELERFYCEILYAAIIKSGSILVGKQLIRFRLELDYDAPYDSASYHRVFGPSVHFNCERRVLSFDTPSIRTAISTANPVAQEIFRRECDRLLPFENTGGSVSERVQQVLLKAGSEFPNSSAVAKKLNISESTLQRRLSKEGCRFQQLLDQVRSRLASEYLITTTLPVSEVAYLLGFSDAANFRRSFKRWTKTTPSALRQEGMRLSASAMQTSPV